MVYWFRSNFTKQIFISEFLWLELFFEKLKDVILKVGATIYQKKKVWATLNQMHTFTNVHFRNWQVQDFRRVFLLFNSLTDLRIGKLQQKKKDLSKFGNCAKTLTHPYKPCSSNKHIRRFQPWKVHEFHIRSSRQKSLVFLSPLSRKWPLVNKPQVVQTVVTIAVQVAKTLVMRTYTKKCFNSRWETTKHRNSQKILQRFNMFKNCKNIREYVDPRVCTPEAKRWKSWKILKT